MLATAEIDGKVYTDGDSVRNVRKNFLICGFDYDVQFYGYDEHNEEIYKHFLNVRMFFSKFNWAFRTRHRYELPHEG